MKSSKTIIFLLEMPLTNGVIQAQILPVILESARQGYKVEVLETTGRFDSQEETRVVIEKKLSDQNINLHQIAVPRFTFLPSILYFTFKTPKILRPIIEKSGRENVFLYARNYKFTFLLLWEKFWQHIPFIYSPRGAYVAERKFYRRSKDLLYAGFIKFFERRAIQKSIATIVETEAFREHLMKNYQISGENIKIIPNFYDHSLLPMPGWDREEMRQKLGFSGKKVIVYAGTVEVWYDFEKMFDLVSRLKKKDPAIFFQLFLKKDFAREESIGIAASLRDVASRYNLKENVDFGFSSFFPSKRYEYLAACDAGICLTTPEEFKTMMLYLKIVDYLGVGLPLICNSEIAEASKIVKETGQGAIVDYNNWEKSIDAIGMKDIFEKKVSALNYIERYSSEKIIPGYLEIFHSIWKK